MNYDEIVKALKEERRLNEELGKIIEEPSYYDPTHYEDEEGNIKPIPTKKQRNGSDLDSLDAVSYTHLTLPTKA